MPYNNSPTGISLNNVTLNEQEEIGTLVGELAQQMSIQVSLVIVWVVVQEVRQVRHLK